LLDRPGLQLRRKVPFLPDLPHSAVPATRHSFLAPPKFGRCCHADREIACASPHPALLEAAARDSEVLRCVVLIPIEAGNAPMPFAVTALKMPTYTLLGSGTSATPTLPAESSLMIPWCARRSLCRIARLEGKRQTPQTGGREAVSELSQSDVHPANAVSRILDEVRKKQGGNRVGEGSFGVRLRFCLPDAPDVALLMDGLLAFVGIQIDG